MGGRGDILGVDVQAEETKQDDDLFLAPSPDVTAFLD